MIMASLRPDTDEGHDLGSSSKKWGTVYASDLRPATMTTTGDVTVGGNLTVSGTSTTLTVQTVEATDPLIKLAKDNTSSDSIDIGFYGAFNDGTQRYAGLARDASDGEFYLFATTSEPTTTIGDMSGSLATLHAAFEGALTGDVTGNADTASTLATARTISISGDVAGSVSFNGSQNVDIAATIQSGAVDNSMLANSGVTIGDGTNSETLSLGGEFEIKGTANEVEVVYSTANNDFTIGLPSTISGLTSVSSTGFTGALTGNASTASTLQTARTLSISGDASGSVSFNGGADADIALTIANSAVEDGMLAQDYVQISEVDGSSIEWDALGGHLQVKASGITNAMLAGSIANDKLSNSTVSYGGVQLSLGGSDATPAFDLSDATNYPTASLVGTIQNDQLAGSIANAKLANSSTTFSDGSNTTAIALGSQLTIQGTSNEVEVVNAAGVFTVGLPSTITASLSGNASTATALQTSRNFSITGSQVTAGAIGFDGSGNVALSASITDGSVTNANLANDGWTLSLNGTGQEDINLGDSLDFNGTASQISIAYDSANNDLTFSLPSEINVDTSGNAATATALASSQNFSISSGPVTAAAVSFDGTGAVALTSAIASGAITNAMLANSSLTFTDGTNSEALALGSTVEFGGTSNEVEVAYTAASNKFTIGLPSSVNITSNLDVGGNATVSGALTVTGNVTASGQLTASGANISFADNLIEFGVNNTAVEDIGFYGQRGDGSTGQGFAGFAWDESVDEWVPFTATSGNEPTDTVGTHSKAKIHASELEAEGAVIGQLRTEGSAPSTASDTGTAGDIRYDSAYIYVCVDTDTWKRVAITGW